MSRSSKPQALTSTASGTSGARLPAVADLVPVTKRTHRKSTEAKLRNLLSAAAKLMAEQGYDNTSIRDVGRATGQSLAGMYFYFESKDDLLFQIQSVTFEALHEAVKLAVETAPSAEERLRAVIRAYLAFFVTHTAEMKVCAFEFESLRGAAFKAVREIRLKLYRVVAGVIAEWMGVAAAGADVLQDRAVRHHTLFVFGMLNWLFMWFDSKRDAPVEDLAEEMIAMILNGLPKLRRK